MKFTAKDGKCDELLSAQNDFTKEELERHIADAGLQGIADRYIEEIFNPSWKEKLFTASHDAEQIGGETGKWCIFFIYEYEEHIGRGLWDEAVIMTSDGTIIISSNNFEMIDFS